MKKVLDDPKELKYYVYLKDIRFFDELQNLYLPYESTQVVIECKEIDEVPDSSYSIVLKKTDPDEHWYAKALRIGCDITYIAIYDIKENTINIINEKLSELHCKKEKTILNYPMEFEFISVN